MFCLKVRVVLRYQDLVKTCSISEHLGFSSFIMVLVRLIIVFTFSIQVLIHQAIYPFSIAIRSDCRGTIVDLALPQPPPPAIQGDHQPFQLTLLMPWACPGGLHGCICFNHLTSEVSKRHFPLIWFSL